MLELFKKIKLTNGIEFYYYVGDWLGLPITCHEGPEGE